MKHTTLLMGVVAAFALAPVARAEDLQTYRLEMKDHHFDPAELHVPAGKPFFLVVRNSDDAAAEFEMHSPALEKVIQPKGEGRLRVRPLNAGRYKFFDDFHESTTQGEIVAE